MEQRADEAVGKAFFGILAVCWLIGGAIGYLTVGGIVGGLVLGTLVACAVGRHFLRGGGDGQAEDGRAV